MKIETSFMAQAPPDRVFAFLLDVQRVVGCVPGAELSEVVDTDTYRGVVRIRVGPVTVAYEGSARIAERDARDRTATLVAEGRESRGSGGARAITAIAVYDYESGSKVMFVTDLTVTGRVAQFGRGMLEDIARNLVAQMGECIRANIDHEEAPSNSGGSVARPLSASGASPLAMSAPLDTIALARAAARRRLGRLVDQPGLLVALGGVILVVAIISGWIRRR